MDEAIEAVDITCCNDRFVQFAMRDLLKLAALPLACGFKEKLTYLF